MATRYSRGRPSLGQQTGGTQTGRQTGGTTRGRGVNITGPADTGAAAAQAVILAAGLGTRLGDENDGKPKGLLQLGKQSIIEESIDKLIKSGIEKIWIGTGYQ